MKLWRLKKMLSLRRNKELINIRKDIIESFVKGDSMFTICCKNYLDEPLYLEYFKNDIDIKCIFEKVYMSEHGYPIYTPSRITIKFTKHSLDIESLNKMIRRENEEPLDD